MRIKPNVIVFTCNKGPMNWETTAERMTGFYFDQFDESVSVLVQYSEHHPNNGWTVMPMRGRKSFIEDLRVILASMEERL